MKVISINELTSPRTLSGLGIVVLVLCAHALYYNYTSDDAFITFRYVQNFISGNGLVYNPGERVEGYTNFLWAMLLAALAAFRMKIELAARMLGILFGAATIMVVTAIARLWIDERLRGNHRFLLFLPGALLAVSGPFALWTLGGLETIFFTFLLALATYVHLSSNRARTPILTGLILALLVMARPDGIVFVAAFLAHAALIGAHTDTENVWKRRLTNSWVLVAVFSIIYQPYFIWRYTYYGYVFPNTFYAKVGGATAFSRGLQYVWLFLSTYGMVPIASASAFFYARMQQTQPTSSLEKKDSYFSILLAAQIILYLAFIICVGGDQLVMKRFFVPLLPGIYLLSFRGVSQLFFQRVESEKMNLGRQITLAAALAAALAIILLPSFTGREHNRIFNAEKPADVDRKEIGEWLKQNVELDATIALVPAGIIPYYSGLRAIDLVGLNDVNIAHSNVPDFGTGAAGHEKYNSTYVLERKPDLIFLGACRIWPDKFTAQALENYYWMYGSLVPGNRQILRLDEFKKNYSPYAVKVGDGYLHFFKRNDFPLPLAEPLTSSMGTG